MLIEPFILRPDYADRDIQRIQNLADQALGADYVRADACTRANTLVARPSKDGGICGFLVYDLEKDEAGEPQGLQLRTFVVDPYMQGQGVATALGHHLMREHEGLRCWAAAWIRDRKVPADHLLRALGLQPARHIPNYWREDSIRRGYSCVHCGTPCCASPCRCSARIYETAPSFQLSPQRHPQPPRQP